MAAATRARKTSASASFQPASQLSASSSTWGKSSIAASRRAKVVLPAAEVPTTTTRLIAIASHVTKARIPPVAAPCLVSENGTGARLRAVPFQRSRA